MIEEEKKVASAEEPVKRRRPKKKKVVSAISSLDMAIKAAGLAEEKLGDDILLLDVAEITSYTSYVLLISAKNSRLAASLSNYLEDLFATEFGQRPLSREGLPGTGWMLLDFGDIIIHVFTPEERARYDLEGFWPDAKRITTHTTATK